MSPRDRSPLCASWRRGCPAMTLCVALASLASPTPAAARAPGFTVGGGLGYFLPAEAKAYVGRSPMLTKKMGGDLDGDGSDGVALSLHQGFRVNAWFGLQVRERLMSVETASRFDVAPSLNHEMSRRIIPVSLTPRLLLENADIGFALGAGPSLYWVETKERGYFGDAHRTETRLGFLVNATLALYVSPSASIDLEYTRDFLGLVRVNPMLRDGGDGDASTFGLGFTYGFGG